MSCRANARTGGYQTSRCFFLCNAKVNRLVQNGWVCSICIFKCQENKLDEDLGYSKYDYKNKTADKFWRCRGFCPRDRKGELELQFLKKNQTCISQVIEEKILSMYAKGMTTGDIESHIQAQ